MNAEAFLFWFLSVVTIGSALAVLLFTNPIFSALSLAMTMVGVAGVFVMLGAYFIAGVQMIVYAGAVMVLFVMVLMLFDLKQELLPFSRGQITGTIKLLTAGLFAGLIIGVLIKKASNPLMDSNIPAGMANNDNTKELGVALFTKHVLSFEVLGVLLLVIAVGTVALARSRGGTHHGN